MFSIGGMQPGCCGRALLLLVHPLTLTDLEELCAPPSTPACFDGTCTRLGLVKITLSPCPPQSKQHLAYHVPGEFSNSSLFAAVSSVMLGREHEGEGVLEL